MDWTKLSFIDILVNSAPPIISASTAALNKIIFGLFSGSKSPIPHII